MNILRSIFTLVILLISSAAFAETYYSLADGDWATASLWSTRADGTGLSGVPTATDDVVIRHTIVHDAGLGYVHYGNIEITASGTYSVGTGTGVSQPYFFAGELFEVYGELITSSDFEHQLRPGTGGDGTEDGVLLVHETAILDIGDDLILNSSSITLLNNAACGDGWCHDDIYFVGPTAQICGEGKFIVPDLIRAWANVDKSSERSAGSDAWQIQLENQICKDFTLYGSKQDCDNNVPRFTGQSSFPVEFLSFEAELIDEQVLLSWTTASELNNDFFTIERSVDGRTFEAIDRVQGAGTTESASHYQVFDASPISQMTSYRIKQTDFDGHFSYSETVQVRADAFQSQLTVFPNPASAGAETLHISGWNPNHSYALTMLDVNGSVLLEAEIPAQTSQAYPIAFPSDLASGLYFITISNETEQLSQQIIIR